jgi:hypothetical protein
MTSEFTNSEVATKCGILFYCYLSSRVVQPAVLKKGAFGMSLWNQGGDDPGKFRNHWST